MTSKVKITFQDVKASVIYTDARLLTAFTNLKMTDVRLNPDSLNQYFDQDADTIQFTDAFSFNFSKSVADSIGITESSTINFNKALTESLSFSDSATVLLTLNRSFSDSVSVGDSFSKLLEIGLALSDGMAIDDTFNNVVSTEIQKSNVVNMVESLSFELSKALTDTATVTDAISLQYDPNFSHSVTMSESFSTSFISGTPSLFNNPTMNTATFNG